MKKTIVMLSVLVLSTVLTTGTSADNSSTLCLQLLSTHVSAPCENRKNALEQAKSDYQQNLENIQTESRLMSQTQPSQPTLPQPRPFQ